MGKTHKVHYVSHSDLYIYLLYTAPGQKS